MAIIECVKTKKNVYLQSYHIFGRHTSKSDTYLEKKDISQIHASARWEGAQWILIDHSRNGTFIDDKRIPKGKGVVLTAGSYIRFGGSPDSCWRIIDVSEPSAFIQSIEDDSRIITLEGFNIFPDEEHPEVSIYRSESGKWKYEKDTDVGFLNNGDVIEINSFQWRFFNSNIEDSTVENEIPVDQNGPSTRGLEFVFYVSQDEEHVTVKIYTGTEVVSLGERVHHYLLLTLARRRFEDFTNNIDPLSRGWIELRELSDMLDLDQCHLNIQIFRARKQILTTLPHMPNLVNTIERRPGDIRFGITDFKIYSGSNLEGECHEIE